MLRRSLAELRKLQTERAIRLELNGGHLPGLVDSNQLINTVRDYDKHLAKEAKADEALGMKTPLDSSFCNPTQTTPKPTPRNAFCPCKSGEKYKRCCGKNAPPVLNMAA